MRHCLYIEYEVEAYVYTVNTLATQIKTILYIIITTRAYRCGQSHVPHLITFYPLDSLYEKCCATFERERLF